MLQFLKVNIWLYILLRIRESIIIASWFSIKILSLRSPFGFGTEKNMMKRMDVCNVEIRIEETLYLLKARAVIKENVKISTYLNKQSRQTNLRCYLLVRKNHGCINFFLCYQFETFCSSWYKFLIGNFTLVVIRNFFLIENPNF